MARLNINIGTTANDKTGDPLRTAFDKVNQNFVELYAHVGADVQIPSQTNNGGKYLTTNGTALSWGDVSQGNIFDQDLNTTDNVQFAYVTSTEAVKLSNSDTVVGAIGSSPTSVNIEGWLGNSVNIVTNDLLTWTFDANGILTVPAVSGENLFIQGPEIGSTNSGIGITATNGIVLTTDALGTAKFWQFGTDGNLSVPGNITKASGNLEITAENYVVIDSTNGGQIDIGANQSGEGSGVSGPILMGHAGNTLDIQSGKIRVNSAVPTHSTGALDDVVGLVAFDGSYIYYCTADYVSAGGGGATVELVPNELGQSVNTITIAKGAPPNTNWANLQVSWTLTVNSTTVTVEEITGDADNLYVVVSGFITLPPTGSITFTEPGGTQPDIWKRVAWSNDTW